MTECAGICSDFGARLKTGGRTDSVMIFRRFRRGRRPWYRVSARFPCQQVLSDEPRDHGGGQSKVQTTRLPVFRVGLTQPHLDHFAQPSSRSKIRSALGFWKRIIPHSRRRIYRFIESMADPDLSQVTWPSRGECQANKWANTLSIFYKRHREILTSCVS